MTAGGVDPADSDVIRSTSIGGVFLILPRPIADERGFFSRTLDLEWLRAAGLESTFVHHNQSRSGHGVVRGLHVRGGRGEVKLVRCAHGAIVDFVVDVRPWSPTFRHVERFRLDDVSLEQLYLPPFVAHGYQVISDQADVCYLHSRPYEPGADLAIAWNDASLALDWPIEPARPSASDNSALPLDAAHLAAMLDQPADEVGD